jgi:hypothetical protein
MAGLAERWRGLHRLVSGGPTDKCIEDLEKARALFAELSSDTAVELRGIFDQDSKAAEFQALAAPFTGQGQSLLEARQALAAAAMERIDWLTKLQNDLGTFVESGPITGVGWAGAR